MQHSEGRYFLHEHPQSASSWQINCIKRVRALKGVDAVVGHMCRVGMTMEEDGQGKKVYKPTLWMSNAPHVLKHMHKLCTKDHEHVRLTGQITKQVAIYPDKLCISILKGVRDQLQHDGLISLDNLESGTICEDFSEQQHEYLAHYVDNISGAPLKNELVQEARGDEITGINRCKVWDKVPIK